MARLKRELERNVSPEEMKRALADQASLHSLEMSNAVKKAREAERKHYSKANEKLKTKIQDMKEKLLRAEIKYKADLEIKSQEICAAKKKGEEVLQAEKIKNKDCLKRHGSSHLRDIERRKVRSTFMCWLLSISLNRFSHDLMPCLVFTQEINEGKR